MLRRLGRDIAIYGTSDLAFRLVSFAVFPVYAHLFSVEEFGVMALATTAASLIAIVGSLGANSAVQRYYWDPETSAERQPLIVTTGFLVLVSSCALLISVVGTLLYSKHDWLAEKYSLPWLVFALAIGAILPEQVLQYALDVLRLQFKPFTFAVISFLKNLAGVLLGLLLVAAFSQGLPGVFWGPIIAASLAAPFALFTIRKELTLAFDFSVARQLVAFGFPLAISGLAFWVFNALDRWVLAEMSTVEQVGLYSIAFKFSSVLALMAVAFGQAWSPLVIKLMRDDPTGYRDTLSRILDLWSAFLVLVGSGIALFGADLLKLLTPEPYWHADIALALLAAAMVANGTIQVSVIGISIARRTHLVAAGAIVAAIINLGLNILLVPSYGSDGAAAAAVVGYFSLTGLYLLWSQTLHPLPLNYLKLMILAAILSMSVGVALAIRLPHWSLSIFTFKVVMFSAIIICAIRFIVGSTEARQALAVLWPGRAGGVGV